MAVRWGFSYVWGGVQVVSAAQRAGHAWSLCERKLWDNPLLQVMLDDLQTPPVPLAGIEPAPAGCNTPRSASWDTGNSRPTPVSRSKHLYTRRPVTSPGFAHQEV